MPVSSGWLWHVFALEHDWAIGLAALLGLPIGLGLTLLIQRLPRQMERDWQPGAVAAPAADVAPPIGARRYAAVAGLSAALFAASVWRFGPTLMALNAMALLAALLALAWIDYDCSLLPDVITLPLLWAGLMVNLHAGLTPLPMAVLGAALGYGFLWSVFHVFLWLTGREGMGYGDFKMSAALGAWLGLAALPWLLLGASLVGLAGACLLRLSGRTRHGQALPFGPYLAIAGAIALLGGFY